MARLIRVSRHTLIILSPRSFDRRFVIFEGQLTRTLDPKQDAGRLIPLIIEKTKMPDVLQHTAAIDLTLIGEAAAWRRLRHAIQVSGDKQPGHAQLGADLLLWRAVGRYGYGARNFDSEYHGSLMIWNPNVVPLEFDAITLETTNADISPLKQVDAAHAVQILFRGQSNMIRYSYRGTADFEPVEFDHAQELKTVAIPGQQGISFRNIPLGPLRFSVPAQMAVPVGIYVSLGDLRVSETCWALLPPLARLPVDDGRPGIKVEMFPDRSMSSPSGVLDTDLVRSALDTAARFSSDSLLVSVQPQIMTV